MVVGGNGVLHRAGTVKIHIGKGIHNGEALQQGRRDAPGRHVGLQHLGGRLIGNVEHTIFRNAQRLQVGGDYKVNKGHTITMAYLYQHGENEDNGDANLHVLSVGYKFKF